MTLLEIAKRYVEKGLSVIPLAYKDKTPDASVLPNGSWKEFKERRATQNDLVNWFSTEKRNIGIVTGKISGFVVVDVDGPEGEVERKAKGIRSPLRVNSGRIEGGTHFYFKYPNVFVGNGVKVKPGIDIRGDGGYVVAPPSIHESGKQYMWIREPGEIPVFNTDWLPKKEVNNNQPGWIADALASLAPGNRDSLLTKIVGQLHRANWRGDDIVALLSVHPEVIAHGLTELNRIVKSIGIKPRPLQVDEMPSQSLSQFMHDDIKVEWIVPGIVGKETLGFIAGLPETNKTWLAMDLALEAAQGGIWLGKFPVNKSKVLFIDQERFSGETRRRFKALMAAKSIPPVLLEDNLNVWCGTTIRIDLEHSFNAFQKKLDELRPDLVIVDSFATFHTKEENNRSDVQIVLEKIKQLRNEFRCTFLFIDHENKGVFTAEIGETPSALRMAGSIAKPAAAELILTVRAKGKNRSAIYITKSTLGNAVEPFVVEVKDIGGPDKIEVKIEGNYNDL